MMNPNVESFYPLSPMQQGMLFHTLYAPRDGVYVDQQACLLRGALDLAAFEGAWQQAAALHPVLRTAFIWKGLKEPVQTVHRSARVPVTYHDWAGLSAGEREARLAELVRENRRRGFDLAAPPLMRLDLMRVDEETHQLLWCRHHMMMDGWSVPLLLRDIFACYEASVTGAKFEARRPRPYRDYIAWLRRQDLNRAETFWRRTLKGFTSPTPLAPASPGANASDGLYPAEEFSLSEPLTERVRALAAEHELTLNTVVQGAWALLLSRYAGTDDVLFGAIVSGRPPSFEGVESMLGLFINALPVRVRVPEGAALIPWLKELQARQVEAHEYEYTPLLQVQGWSEAPRGVPLFQSLLVFENYPVAESLRGQGLSLEVSDFRVFEQTNYPLTLDVSPGPRLTFRMLYDGRRYDPAAVRRILSHLANLLSGFVSGETVLGNIELTGADERALITGEWNSTRAELPGVCAHELFEEQARQRPEAAALRCGGAEMSYGELDARSSRLAALLRESGVGAGSVVGLHLPRGVEAVVGMLGVWKAGGAYLPLDPTYPLGRLSFMLEDAAASVVLSLGELADKLPSGWFQVINLDEEWERLGDGPAPTLSTKHTPDSLAYVLYTSGSTGAPKGVMLPHRALVNYLLFARSAYGLGPGSPAPCHSPLGFDLTVTSLWAPLASGGVVELLGDRPGVEALAEALSRRGGYGLVKLTPAHLRALDAHMGGEAASRAARAYVIGGEALTYEALREWRAGGTRLINEYGPTEAAVGCCWFEVGAEDEGGSGGVGIGRPVANARVYVVGAGGRLCGAGVAGELYVGGEGLARGYVGRPGLTAERFVPDPFSSEPGARLYRTGDLARYLHDGGLEYLGRRDEQVKVRGYRIELGEIEAALSAHPGVRGCVVAAREEPGGGKRLVAYVVSEDGQELKAAELRAHLHERLPEYMVPSFFVMLDSLPLNANGKVDRKALPEPGAHAADSESYVAPRTPVEETLAAIWSQVLGLERVGVNDSFFDLGGHSLLAMQLITRVREAFGVELPLARLFDEPTVARTAEVVGELVGQGEAVPAAPAGPVITRRARSFDEQLAELERLS